MIEQDVNDSFPESEFVTWTCPMCHAEQQVQQEDLARVQCPCDLGLMQGSDADWFEIIDPVERVA